jgi:TetR/AcrR family transcriptional repressor of uid operon
MAACHRLDEPARSPLTDGVIPDTAEPSRDPLRDRLVAAAADVFAEKGYDGAGVAEIARRAGLTTGAIYGRFTGKAELLLAAIEAQTDDEFEQLFAEHRFEGDATDIITTVGSHLVTDGFDSGQALLLEAFVGARRDPEVARLLRKAITRRTEELTLLVEEAKRVGDIDPNLDTLSIVRFCHAVAFGFLLLGAVDLDRPKAPPWEELIRRLVGAVADPDVAANTHPAPGGGAAEDG